MSANDPARLHSSRRTLLTSAAAGLAAGGTAYAAQSAAAAPDPVFALIEAERRAWEAFEQACSVYSEAEDQLWASEWNRNPRVLVGEYTAMTRGSDFAPIPVAERVAEPVYVHDHDAIDLDCDRHAKAPGADPAAVEARRARLHRGLDEDAAAIAAAPEVVREAEADHQHGEARDAYGEALEALHAVPPTTLGGLHALVDVIERRARDGLDLPEHLAAVIAAVRAVLKREA